MVALLDQQRVLGRRRRCPRDWDACSDDTPPDSPADVIAPIEYPTVVLAELGGHSSCRPVPDGSVVFSDGRNLWVRSVHEENSAGVVLIADRARLTEANADLLRELLWLPKGAAFDDASLRGALETVFDPTMNSSGKPTAAERARKIKALCARRAAEQSAREGTQPADRAAAPPSPSASASASIAAPPASASSAPSASAIASAAAKPPLDPPPRGKPGGHLAPEVIQRVVRQEFGRFRLCFESTLRTSPNLQNRVAVQFVIDVDGTVKKPRDAGSETPDAALRACVIEAFRALQFPPPEGAR